MKIAISSEGREVTDRIDTRFGRARGFIIIDTESGETVYVDNRQNLDSPQGAGIQSARTVIEAGAMAVITGNVGPKAFSALNSAEIEIYLFSEGTVNDAVQAFREGNLTRSDGANVEGHW